MGTFVFFLGGWQKDLRELLMDDSGDGPERFCIRRLAVGFLTLLGHFLAGCTEPKSKIYFSFFSQCNSQSISSVMKLLEIF